MIEYLVFFTFCCVMCCMASIFDFLFFRIVIKKYDVKEYQNRLHTLELDVSRLRYERDCMRIELDHIKSYLIGPEYKNYDKECEKSDC